MTLRQYLRLLIVGLYLVALFVFMSWRYLGLVRNHRLERKIVRRLVRHV